MVEMRRNMGSVICFFRVVRSGIMRSGTLDGYPATTRTAKATLKKDMTDPMLRRMSDSRYIW